MELFCYAAKLMSISTCTCMSPPCPSPLPGCKQGWGPPVPLVVHHLFGLGDIELQVIVVAPCDKDPKSSTLTHCGWPVR